MRPTAFLIRSLTLCSLALPGALIAEMSTAPPTDVIDSTVAAVTTQPSNTPQKPLLGRWIDLTTFSHSERFRDQYGDTGYHYFDNGQQRSVISGLFKFDEDGRYGIGFRASSGRSFNWSYADYAGGSFTESLNQPGYTAALAQSGNAADLAVAQVADPVGYAFVNNLNSAGWEFYVRELYLKASPISAVTFEFGSLGFERGFASEITTFDDDGYLAGERVRIRDPKHLFVDEVGFTNAYMGDFEVPNFFSRGDRLSRSNYRQVYAKKQLNSRVGVSADYTWLIGTHTLHQALTVGVKETRLFDKVRLETYERLNSVTFQGDYMSARQGVALVGEKKIGKFSVDFGGASIDRDYGVYTGSSFLDESGFSLNGDTYNTGIRVFTHASYKLTPVITAFGYYTHITGENIANINTQGLNAGLSFDLKALVNSKRQVF